MARSLPCWRLRAGARRPFHPAAAGEDPRRPRSRSNHGRTDVMSDFFLSNIAPQMPTIGHALLALAVAALLGAALGIVRPVRSGIVPRSAHVIQAQILLAIVGAIIII